MGVVFLARDSKLNRDVALKMVLGGAVAGSVAFQRFLVEAEALAAVQHPNVVQVFDRGEHQGLPYFTMEFCPNGSLAGRVKESPLPAREAATLIEQLARGVAAAHAQGILHRDLKPDNVLFAADNAPKLTDFGLAKRTADTDTSGLTHTGAVMGTPSYMAPEQARGGSKSVGPGSDVYGLGAILYRVVTGRAPFLGPDPLETLRQVVDADPVSPSVLEPGLPRDLSTICLKCLAKDPDRRYQSAGDLADDLRRFLDGRPILARSIGPIERGAKWVRRNRGTAAGLGLTALSLITGTAVATWQARRATGEAGRADQEASTAKAYALQSEIDAAAARAGEAEARRQSANAAVDEGLRLAREGDGARAVLWFLEANRRSPVDPEFAAVNRIRIATHLRYGKGPTPVGWLLHPSEVSSAIFSPSGQRVLTHCGKYGVQVWDLDTGKSVETPVANIIVHQACFSPDAKSVLVVGQERTPHVGPPYTGVALVWNVGTGRTTKPRFELDFPVQVAEFSPDGKWVVTGGKSARVWDATTGDPVTPVLHPNGYVGATVFSPDGRLVLTGCTGREDQTARIWEVATGRPTTPPITHGAGVQQGAFSPDGRQFLTASRDGTVQVWATGNGEPISPRIRAGEGSVFFAGFSPDGRRVMTTSEDGTVRQWDRVTSRQEGATFRHVRGAKATYSPDGRMLASGSPGGEEVQVWDADTGLPILAPLRHSYWVRQIAFAPDGRRLVTACWDGSARVWDLAMNQGPKPLLQHRTVLYGGGLIAADARTVLTQADPRTVLVWDLAAGPAITAELPGEKLWMGGLSADGRLAVIQSAEDSSSANVWDLTTGTARFRITDLARSPWLSDDDLLVIASRKGDVLRLYYARTGATAAPDIRVGFTPTGTAVSPDGRSVAVIGVSRLDPANPVAYCGIWDTSTAEPLIPVFRLEKDGASTIPTVATFSPNGERLATVAGQMVRVWDSRSGNPVSPSLAHPQTVHMAQFSPSGQRIVTACNDQGIRLWDVNRGTPVQTPPGVLGRLPTSTATRCDRLLGHLLGPTATRRPPATRGVQVTYAHRPRPRNGPPDT